MARRLLYWKSLLIAVYLVLAMSLWNCRKEEAGPIDDSKATEYKVVKDWMYRIMKTYYLWYDHVPTLKTSNFATPQDLLDTLVYKPIDRFSYLAGKTEMQQFFEEGQYVGLGFSYLGDELGKLRVAFVYNASPLKVAGVQRGWIMKSINGTTIDSTVNVDALLGKDEVGVSNTIVFTDPQGTDHSVTASKEVIQMNTVLESKVLTAGDRKVGYLAFESFIAPSVAELDAVFSNFSAEGIDDLIVDLRYNGGGRVNVALEMANRIAGDIASGSVFARFEHNDLLASFDTVFTLENAGYSFGFNRLFFITAGGTASASEMIINGLGALLPVYLVGEKTYGKPVGMYAFESENYDYVFVPICFKTSNADNVGDYYDGIPVNSEVPDDLLHALGDIQESCLAATLQYIETGSFPLSRKSASLRHGWGLENRKGLRAEIGAY
jgi:carboxyl-terminal processing protease